MMLSYSMSGTGERQVGYWSFDTDTKQIIQGNALYTFWGDKLVQILALKTFKKEHAFMIIIIGSGLRGRKLHTYTTSRFVSSQMPNARSRGSSIGIEGIHKKGSTFH